mgnify:CR=1 FL=1
MRSGSSVFCCGKSMPLPLIRAVPLFSGRASDTSPQVSTSPMHLSEKVQAHEPRQRGKQHTLSYTSARSTSTTFHAPRFHGYASPRHRTMHHLRRRDCDITQPKRVRLTSSAISPNRETASVSLFSPQYASVLYLPRHFIPSFSSSTSAMSFSFCTSSMSIYLFIKVNSVAHPSPFRSRG